MWDRTASGRHAEHLVEFYQTEAHLLERLTRFAAEGLERGQRVVVIATRAHDVALRGSLAARGIAAFDLERVTTVDAETLLGRVVTGPGTIDEAAFTTIMSPYLRDGSDCRVYGELVSLLAARGQLDLALEFERVGQELATHMGVETLCMYHLAHLQNGTGEPSAVERIERLHDRSAFEDSTGGTAGDSTVEAPSGPDPSRIPGPLILLADDFEDAREIYGDYLRFSGVRVITAASGVEAVQLALEHAPDLILMDVRMPGMTGTEAMRVLRGDGRFRPVPIIALTAHALASERAAMLSDGFDGVIAKPCLPQDLLAVIHDLLPATAGATTVRADGESPGTT